VADTPNQHGVRNRGVADTPYRGGMRRRTVGDTPYRDDVTLQIEDIYGRLRVLLGFRTWLGAILGTRFGVSAMLP
jgi:hypothetical protein